MQHYGVGEWTDFVRNLVSEKQRVEMDEHRAVCPDCGSLLAFLSNVAAVGQAEHVYEAASEALSASVRNVFVSEKAPARVREWAARALRTLMAQLTYDSAADLQPAGARAYRPTIRQMLYQAGDYYLDLRFDHESDSPQVTIVGQVANSKDPAFRPAGLQVLVLAEAKVLAQAECNEFGEFSLDYVPQRDLRLSVKIPESGVQLEAAMNGTMEQP